MASNLEIAGAVKRTQKGNADWYYGGDNEAWADLASAKAGVPSGIRSGKTVGVYVSGTIVEYWWPTSGSVGDSDLVIKTPDLSGKASISYVDTQDTALGSLIAAETTNRTTADAANLATAKAYADGLIISVYKDCGNWDASTGSFPTTGGTGTSGAIKAGNAFEVSVAGTVGAESFAVGDIVRALVDTPGQTLANWAISKFNTLQATETTRGIAKIVDQATIQTETSTDDQAMVTTKKFWLGIARLMAIAQTITGNWNFTGTLKQSGNTVETQNNKATDLSSNDNLHYPTTAAVKTVTDANTASINAISSALIPHPTYTAPTAVLSSSQTTTGLEIGQTISIPLTATFNQNDGGTQSSLSIKKAGSSVATASPYTDSSVTMSATAVSYQASFAYAQGPIKSNVLGIADAAGRIAASSTNSNTLTYQGFYKIFYDAVSAAPTNSAQARALTNSRFSNSGNAFTLNTGNALNKFVIVLPPSKTLVSVVDQDALNLDITAQYTSSTLSINDASGTAVTYTLYTMSQSIPYSSSHRHNITIA